MPGSYGLMQCYVTRTMRTHTLLLGLVMSCEPCQRLRFLIIAIGLDYFVRHGSIGICHFRTTHCIDMHSRVVTMPRCAHTPAPGTRLQTRAPKVAPIGISAITCPSKAERRGLPNRHHHGMIQVYFTCQTHRCMSNPDLSMCHADATISNRSMQQPNWFWYMCMRVSVTCVHSCVSTTFEPLAPPSHQCLHFLARFICFFASFVFNLIHVFLS